MPVQIVVKNKFGSTKMGYQDHLDRLNLLLSGRFRDALQQFQALPVTSRAIRPLFSSYPLVRLAV